MRRNRGKQNRGKKTKETQAERNECNVAHIDEEALARAIVSAYRTIREEKKKDEIAQEEKEQNIVYERK